MENLRVIIAGGGTGGHIYPAIAIGHALQRQRPGTQLLFVGAKGKMEMEKVPKEGFEIIGLEIAGFNRSNLLKNLGLPVMLLKSWAQSRSIIKKFKPTAVVGVGGYASFPILSVAQGLGIPTLIQEQNSYAGRSNKILSNNAKAVCVAYKGMESFFPANKITLTGNPVRKVIADMSKSATEGRAAFGLAEGVKTILVIGGSLGAKSINVAIDEQLEEILKGNVQVLWQTGKPYFAQAVKRAAAWSDRVKVQEFIADMDCAYAAADVVVSRAGALAIAELCIAAKPVIFVPYPYAAENHQESNAATLVAGDAAIMINDNEVKEKILSTLNELLGDNDKQQKMSHNLAKMAVRNADEQIAAKVIQIANGN